jgi:hypothetical protein
METYTDTNWGPQEDASHPKEGVIELILTDLVGSLLGHTSIQMGGPIAWRSSREPKTSRSSCEAEIFAMDKGCKTSEMLHNLMSNLVLAKDISNGIPLFNSGQLERRLLCIQEAPPPKHLGDCRARCP